MSSDTVIVLDEADSARMELLPPGIVHEIHPAWRQMQPFPPGTWQLYIRCDHGKQLARVLYPEGGAADLTPGAVVDWVAQVLREYRSNRMFDIAWPSVCDCGGELLHRYDTSLRLSDGPA